MGAAVYFNNTSIGTTTDDKGEFNLTLTSRNTEMIVSYLGYQTIKYTLNSKNNNKTLVFQLIQNINVLNEVVIKSRRGKVSPEERPYYLKQFKKGFLGRSKLASTCEILNDDKIDFYYDKKTKTLEVVASEPIQIMHKGLGYLIKYELVEYKQIPSEISYLGYSKYENLKGKKKEKKRWRKKRERAYKGSMMHFVRSLREGRFSEEGFVVGQFKLIANPERPTEEQIIDARAHIMTTSRASNKNSSKIKAKTDAAHTILHKARLRKIVAVTLKKKLKPEELISTSPEGVKLAFQHRLKISYLKEKEESQFRSGPARLNRQISNAKLRKDFVFLDNSGEIFPALDITIDGYWAYEGFATKLPLNYYLD